MNRHIYCSIAGRKLTYVDFASLLTQLEAVSISRLISSVSNDDNDVLALTPGLLRVGKPIATSSDRATNK